MSEPPLTPMLRQYRELKLRNPDALLLYRMGDFYELFFEDAERAAGLLGLTLTSRDKDKGTGTAVPMAGFPHPALDQYLAKIVAAGLRAAVCEQVEDPKHAKGLVKREIVRVVTPGTLTDEGLLDPKTSNYLAAIVEQRGKLGMAWVELSIGRFSCASLQRREVLDELVRLEPAELIISEIASDAPWVRLIQQEIPGILLTARPSWDSQPEESRRTLFDHFGVATLAGFGIEDDAIEACAAGALVAYLRETQKSALGHLRQIAPYRRGASMTMDETARRSLELTRTLREGKRQGSLLAVMDRTVTPMGARLLSEWLTAPLTEIDRINRRLTGVTELWNDSALRADLRSSLEKAHDLERLSGRAGTGRATPRDLGSLARTLALLPRIKAKLAERSAPLLKELEGRLELCPEIRAAIEQAIVDEPPIGIKDGGLIRDGYHPTLDEYRKKAKGDKTAINRYLAEQAERTGIANLKIGFNKVFGYYIEITHKQAEGRPIPEEFIRKQTIKNGERYITPRLRELEKEIREADERARELEHELFLSLRDRVAAEAPRLIQAGGILSEIDVLCGLAELAAREGYARPEFVSDPVLRIEQGRHPVLDAIMPHGGFVPNDAQMGPDDGLVVILTGPNMAGKSTYIRQIALITIMAQTGSFVPARAAQIGIVDKLFARVGASDELSRGQSTFMVEMTEAANILNNATARSLVILDELGRGTSTFDGVSLAWAIAEFLHDQVGCRTLFATHYHELVDLERSKPRLRNANVAVREHQDEVVFLHQIVAGGADQSYGIQVARLAGVPGPVLERARSILKMLEDHHTRGLQSTPDSSPEDEPGSGSPRPAMVKTARSFTPSLFAAIPDPLIDELLELDLEAIDPLEALQILKRLKEQVQRLGHK